VPNADAVAESSHARRIVNLSFDLLDDEMNPRVISGEDPLECRDVISLAATPRDVAEVESVVNTEVSERCEVLLVDRIPKPQFGSDSTIEVTEHIETVCALGRSRQAKQLGRLEVIEQRFVRRRRRVVELVHD